MRKKGDVFVQKVGFVAPSGVTEKHCPFCLEKLGNAEYFKLKEKKLYKCLKCGQVIDRRFTKHQKYIFIQCLNLLLLMI